MTRLLLFLQFVSGILFAQVDTISINQIRAIHNNGTTFYNANGIDFTSQTLNYSFTEKNLKKVYRKYKVNKNSISSDKNISFNNRTATATNKISDSLNQYSKYYFIENPNSKIQAFWFGNFEEVPNDFAEQMIDLIINENIPKENFDNTTPSTINFAGRQIDLGNNCNWMNINNVQCPYYGQMNWSLHNSLESAKESNEFQFLSTSSKKGGKVVSEEIVDVVFEDVKTKAKRVVYDFTGVKSLLAGMSGGKTLTIYYVAEKVRENYISCVLSHWNNDNINPSGLPPLLEQVMKLETEKK